MARRPGYNAMISDVKNRLYQQSGGNLSKFLKYYQTQLQYILKDLLSYNKLDYNYQLLDGKKEYWISEATSGLAKKWIDNPNLDEKTRQSILSSWSELGNNLQKPRQRAQERAYEIKYMKAMKDAYRLMNEMGEVLRGKPIQYTVAIQSKSGKQVDQFNGLNIDEFLDLATMTSNSQGRLGRRLHLDNQTTVLAKMKTAMSRNSSRITHEQWSARKISMYTSYKDFAKSKSMGRHSEDPNIGRWAKVNEGNTMEGFLRMQKYGLDVKQSMLRTMSAPAASWQGGDFEEWFDPFGIQVKTNDASLTNVNSMISQLIKLDNQINKLDTILQNPQQYEQYMESQGMSNQMDKYFEEQIDGLVMNFLQGSVGEKNQYFQTTYGGKWEDNYGSSG